ncbi:MAG: S66 peptidase family protein [Candidatus Binatia bacterium]
MHNIKPRALNKGDTIGVVAPAGALRDDQLKAGVDALLQAGFKVELSDGIGERKGYLAGDKEKRAKSLEGFFLREDIRAIFCARGGFGSVQLLPLVDPETIRLHPKPFVGYSDVTVLLNWLLQKCGMVAFHGPMVAMEMAQGLRGRTADFFWSTLMGEKRRWQVTAGRTVRPGTAQAAMVGGCLSAVVTTLGTPYEIETRNKILFLEDIGEKPYRIERMLTHLEMAGKLRGIAGLVFGNFTNCEGDDERGFSEIVGDFFHSAPYPVVAGFPSGHGEENLLLPFGCQMALDGKDGVLSLLESPVA